MRISNQDESEADRLFPEQLTLLKAIYNAQQVT